jgi:ketosteroid isomerase-like protein
MSTKTPGEVVAGFWQAFEAGQIDEVFARWMAPDCEMVMPGMPPMRGTAQIRPMFEGYASALPDFAARPVHAVEQGDTWAGETRYTGTHQRALHTPAGVLPPSGREIAWQSADIVRIRDGRIVSWHVYHDPMVLLGQLGAALG